MIYSYRKHQWQNWERRYGGIVIIVLSIVIICHLMQHLIIHLFFLQEHSYLYQSMMNDGLHLIRFQFYLISLSSPFASHIDIRSNKKYWIIYDYSNRWSTRIKYIYFLFFHWIRYAKQQRVSSSLYSTHSSQMN